MQNREKKIQLPYQFPQCTKLIPFMSRMRENVDPNSNSDQDFLWNIFGAQLFIFITAS